MPPGTTASCSAPHKPTMKLVTLTHHPNGQYTARWDDQHPTIPLQFNAIHDADGRLLAASSGARGVPHLTAAQMETAVAHQTEAQQLAAKGAAARPDLADRMARAAQLVDDGAVVLHTEQRATVSGYTVTATACTCKDYGFRAPDGWCKHRLGVRMARALGQPLTGDDEAALSRQARGHARIQREEAAFRRWCNTSAEAGRRYALRAAANGHTTSAPGSKLHQRQQQARQYQDSPDLAAAKEKIIAETRAILADLPSVRRQREAANASA